MFLHAVRGGRGRGRKGAGEAKKGWESVDREERKKSLQAVVGVSEEQGAEAPSPQAGRLPDSDANKISSRRWWTKREREREKWKQGRARTPRRRRRRRCANFLRVLASPPSFSCSLSLSHRLFRKPEMHRSLLRSPASMCVSGWMDVDGRGQQRGGRGKNFAHLALPRVEKKRRRRGRSRRKRLSVSVEPSSSSSS